MALGSDIRAGAAFVELKSNDNGFSRGLKAAERRLDRFGSVARKIGAGLLIGGGLFAPLAASAISAASDTQESLSRFNQIFGNQSKQATEFAQEVAKRIGRSAIDIQDSLATLQGFFVGLGFDESRSRKMSQQLTELAMDFASFNNLTDDEGISRFLSALSGSSEVLDKFGINTKQAALQQELLALGINKAWSSVTEQEKALARMSIITKTMGKQGAIGDATRTAGSFANQMKRLRSSIKDTAIEMGQSLLPFATRVLKIINAIVPLVSGFVKNNKTLVAGVFAVAGSVAALGVGVLGLGLAFSVASIAAGGLAASIALAGSVIGVAGTVLAAILSPIGLVVAAVGLLAAFILSRAIDIGAIVDLLGSVFGGLANNIADTLGAIGRSIMGGELELAIKIAGKGMEIAWASTLSGMRSKWIDFKTFMAKQFIDFGLNDGPAKDLLLNLVDKGGQAQKDQLVQELKNLTKQLEDLKNNAPDNPLSTINAKKLLEGFSGFGGVSSAARTSARGVFQGNALQSLTSPVEDEIAKNTAKTASGIAQLNRTIDSGGGLTFA